MSAVVVASSDIPQPTKQWAPVRVRDLVLKCSQVSPRRVFSNDFVYVDVSAVSSESLSIVSPKRLSVEEAPSRARQLLRSGDVLFATVRPGLRRIALVPSDLDGAIGSTGYCVLRPDPGRIVPAYLYFSCITDAFVTSVVGRQKGSSYPAVLDSDILDQTIPLPPVHEQRRIARILSTVGRRIDAGRLEHRELVRTRASYRTEAISHLLSSANLMLLGNLNCTISTGPFGSQLHAADYQPSGVRVLNPTHLAANGVNDEDCPRVSQETADRLARHLLKEGDVLVPRRGELSRYARIDADLAGSLCGTGCIVIRFEDTRISPDYFATYFGGPEAQQYLNDAATGTIMPNINPKILEAMPIPIPPPHVRDQFVAVCDAFDLAIHCSSDAIAVLEQLFQSTLHQLMAVT